MTLILTILAAIFVFGAVITGLVEIVAGIWSLFTDQEN